jgi:quercetin dioxygenase-like cupin family protein
VSGAPETNPEGTSGSLEEPRLLRRRDMDLRWDIVPQQMEFPHQRGMYEGLNGTSFFAHIAVVPFGQSAPPHANSAEHIIFHLSGDLEWTVGGEVYRVEEHDMIFIPDGVQYSYVNRGAGIAYFVAILGKVDDWPPRGTY